MRSQDNVRFVKGVGEKKAELFRQLGISDVGALVRLFPREYRDRTHPVKLSEAPFDRPCCIKATVTTDVSEHYIRRNMIIYRFTATDGTEEVDITLFNTKYAAEKVKKGGTYLFWGKVDRNYISCDMSSPEIYGENETDLLPVYPQVKGLTSNYIRKTVLTALSGYEFEEPLSGEILKSNGLCGIKEALMGIHCPKTQSDVEKARRRLVFEELFFLQTGILFKRSSRSCSTDIRITDKYLEEFVGSLPFCLTEAQSKVIKECLSDTSSGKPMSRLVQGDVGSGKTAVAAALAYSAVKCGYQACIMAPTEVLASQHYATFTAFLEKFGIKISLLTGSVTKKNKSLIKSSLKSGETDILIGTHAVIEDDVEFQRLGLVVTDEQHRFGVEQRTKLSKKASSPHILVMSATPIPRTMSLIFYGDLDISIIDSLPKDRQPIETYLINSDIRKRAYGYIKKHLDEGRQGYIVCPMVEENDDTDLASAVEYFEKLKTEDFCGYRLGLLHGKMKPKEKEAVMNDFAAGKIDLLIATTVIEVGVDVPNSVIMLIENAERFGLSQLHQLRGRVGRGRYKSTCILLSDSHGGETEKRLKLLCSTTDGFKIADEDLKLRGPGDFLGKRQHGLPELKIADLSEDMELFRAAGSTAKKLYADDPSLSKPEHRILRKEISSLFKAAENYGNN